MPNQSNVELWIWEEKSNNNKYQKNNPSQPKITCQTCNLGHNTKITPLKINKKTIKKQQKKQGNPDLSANLATWLMILR
jgi:hypothetical protein